MRQVLLVTRSLPALRTVDADQSAATPRSSVAGLLRTFGARGALWLGLVLVAWVNAVFTLAPVVPSAALGLAAFVVLPTWALRTKIDWPPLGEAEIWIVSLAYTVLGLLLVGLATNFGLPPLHVARPLAALPVVTAWSFVMVGLLVWRADRTPRWSTAQRAFTAGFTTGMPRHVVVVVLLGLGISAAGAFRLNNGHSGAVAVCAALFWIALLTALLVRSRTLDVVSQGIGIYGVALGLLLMTSLRGWLLVGHDIQYEYKVFELTSNAAYWDPDLFRSAYYACLSITILPTELSHLLGVSGLVVFKVLFPVLFALVPVTLWLLCRRLVSRPLAVAAAALFVVFPTYFSDMPFLGRQEVAFFFVAAALTFLGTGATTRRVRFTHLLLLGVGVMLSHYSTNYFFLFTVGMAAVGGPVLALLGRWRLQKRPLTGRRGRARPDPAERPVFRISWLLVMLAITVLWTGPITHSGSQVAVTFESLSDSLFGGATSERSSDVRYSLFSGPSETSAQKFARFQHDEWQRREDISNDSYLYPVSEVAQHPIGLSPNETTAFTPLGRSMSAAGLDPSVINSFLRRSIALLFQLLLVVGIVGSLVSRRTLRRMNPELRTLSAASFVLIGLTVLLPSLSVNYGVLRAFQQGLVIFAPLVALGCFMVLQPLRQRAFVGVGVVTAAFALSLTGVIPQLLGGYPRQLHLNNAGQYYDIYVTHDEEAAAMEWFNTFVARPKDKLTTDKYTSSRLQNFTGVQPDFNLYPSDLPRENFVILGTTTVQTQKVTVFFEGDLFSYTYPTAFLDQEKSLVYASGGARIYR
jgi:uncharacterized membrane protein